MENPIPPEGKPGNALQLFFILGGILFFAALAVTTAYFTFGNFAVDTRPDARTPAVSFVQEWRKTIVKSLSGEGENELPDTPGERPVEPAPGEEESSDLQGAFTRVTPVPDVIGNIYFLGIYKNTGDRPIRKPRVDIVLLDKKGDELKRGFGYGTREFLLPGEETPLKILVLKTPPYAKIRTEFRPEPPLSIQKIERPDLKFSGVKIGPRGGGYYHVTGRITNHDKVQVSGLRIIAVLYDRSDNPAAVGSGFARKSTLAPRQSTTFDYRLHPPVKTTPVRHVLDFSARIK